MGWTVPTSSDAIFLKNRADVLFVLRALAMHKALVTVYIDASRTLLLSTVLQINEEKTVYISIPPNPKP